MAGAGRRVFSRGLRFNQNSRRRAVHFRLCVFSCPAHRPAERPPRILFRAGNGISLRRAATVFLLGNFWPGGDCPLDRIRVLDRIVHGDCLRRHPALGESQSDVAGSDCLDWNRILSQRALLPEIFVAEYWICLTAFIKFYWNVWSWLCGCFFNIFLPSS